MERGASESLREGKSRVENGNEEWGKGRKNCVWTIPKAKRFYEKESLTKDAKLVDLGSMLSKSATGLGYGKRYEFRINEGPAPSLTHRDLSSSKVKRIKSESVGVKKRIGNGVPGPGSYNLVNLNFGKKKGVLIKSRKELFDSRKDFPGPGCYHPDNWRVRKRFDEIRFGSSLRYDFTGGGIERSPGPAAYEILADVDKGVKELKERSEMRKEKMKLKKIVMRYK